MRGSERKRPWYLVVALLLALAFGANCARVGWTIIGFYREPVDPDIGQGIADDADRAAVVSTFDGYMRALDHARPRQWPFSVAMLVLGSATLFFAMRAMGGSSSARNALVQLIVAQTLLKGGSHWLLRDVDEAYLRWGLAENTAIFREETPDRAQADQLVGMLNRTARMTLPLGLALDAIGSALIVVALTRRRSRDFFDGAAAAVGER